MEIKDIVGLSQPLTKLIEVVSEGIGCCTKPYFIRKNADAKAYEIEKISEAIERNRKVLQLIEYNDTKVKLLGQQDQISDGVPDEYRGLIDRAKDRETCREIKRQINIENTIFQAAQELSKDQTVSDESLSEDWVSRFFNIVEDISSEEMQSLWCKILAGEIRKPRTYSLKTLDVLRNITPQEAETFCKIGALALFHGDEAFVLDEREFLEKQQGIGFTDLLLLQDLGLMLPKELRFSFEPCDKNVVSHLIWGDTIVVVRRTSDTPIIPLNVSRFTQTGKELLNLVDKPLNESYLRKLSTKLKISDDIKVLYGKIIGFEEGFIRHADLCEIMDTPNET